MTSPWKGKPSFFFLMEKLPQANVIGPIIEQELNEEQWDFVFQYYPEYAQAPYDIIRWIY